MPFITRHTRPNTGWGKNLGQLNKDLSTFNPWTSKYSICPTYGRENAHEFKLVKKTRLDHGRGNAEYINTKTIQHMDEEKVVMKDYKFKDVMKNHYFIMFFQRRVETDEIIF